MNQLLDNLEIYTKKRISEFSKIPDKRKTELKKVSNYIKRNVKDNQKTELTFICTHNSRRSHMSQIWAQTASYKYGVKSIKTYSGGTEATAFNPRAVRALQKAGFKIEKMDNSGNPVYKVSFAKDTDIIKAFSKKYDDKRNPQSNYCAIMTCSQADEACPVVFGATERFSITYEDPKAFDNTDQEEEKYDKCCQQIARELLYIFSLLKTQKIRRVL